MESRLLSSLRRGPIPLAGSAVVLGLALWGCGGGDDEATVPSLSSIVAEESAATTTQVSTTEMPTTEQPTTELPTTGADTTTTVADTTTTVAAVEPLEIDENSFVALRDMTPIRGFFVDNLAGDVDATIAAANAVDGAIYPYGSVVQLIPGEVMVKREPGFSPTTNDWEFFELDVSEAGSVIRVRGGDEVVNRFGLSCAECHSLADPSFDFVCEQDHGCEPLPFTRETIEQIQDGDPRPLLVDQ